jgi:hypothetical protein
LLLPLGKSWWLPSGEVNFMVPIPTYITAPMSFSRDLPLQKSSFSPATAPEKLLMVWCWRTSWEPQEEGVMSIAVSFPSVMKPKFNRPVGERNHFWRLLLTGFWQGALLAPAATWNLHTTQPRYFAPTCSEVVNLTGLLKTKD